MKVVCLALALIVVCSAQTPVPCQSPKQWTGRRIQIDTSKQYREISHIWYDELYMRTRVTEEIDAGTERDYYDTLTLYSQNKEYRLNIRTKQCNVTTVSHPFFRVGVPADAKFLFEAEIGAADIDNEHLTAVTFGGEFPQDHVKYTTSVTYPDCVPIGDNYYNDVVQYVETRYFDIHAGISNPDAFLPPTGCPQF